MAFFARVGNILRQATNKQLSSELRSTPSIFQAIRCMSSAASSKLFIGGLSFSTDEQSLRETFAKYGEIVDARIIMDRDTGRSRGFGFVTFTSVEEASSAIQALDGQDLHGRRVKVNYANERTRGFGGGGGFGGSYGNAPYGGGAGAGYGGGYGNPPYGGGSGAYGGNAAGGYGGGGYGGGSYGSGGNAAGGYGGSDSFGTGSAGGSYGGSGMNYGNEGNFTSGSTYAGGSSGGYGGGNTYAGGSSGGYGGNEGSFGVAGGAGGSDNYGSAPSFGAAAGGGSDSFGSPAGFSSTGATGSGSSFASGYDGSGGVDFGSSDQLDNKESGNVGGDVGDYGNSLEGNYRDDDDTGDFAKRA